MRGSWPLILISIILASSCDDPQDLTLPEGQRPDAPVVVAFRPDSADFVELRWTRNPQAEGYFIYSADESDGRFERAAATHDTVWRQDLWYSSSPTRFWHVTSIVDGKESPKSGQIGGQFIVHNVSTPPYSTPVAFGFFLTAWRRDAAGVPLPFTQSQSVRDIIGDQYRFGARGSADEFWATPDTTAFAHLVAPGEWTGPLADSTISWSRPYVSDAAAGHFLFLVLCGKVHDGDVDPVWIDGGERESPGTTIYTFRESRHKSVRDLRLLESGFQGDSTISSSDLLLEWRSGMSARYSTLENKWLGFDEIVPGRCYTFVIRHPGGFWYDYEPSGS